MNEDEEEDELRDHLVHEGQRPADSGEVPCERGPVASTSLSAKSPVPTCTKSTATMMTVAAAPSGPCPANA